MKVYKSITPLVAKTNDIRRQNKSIGLVPTMGCLHEGHLSLIKKARKDTDCVVVSIFVNPIQFGPREDLKEYPQDLKRDLGLCRKIGVDIVFLPDTKSMYSNGFSTYVNVEGITDGLCGAARPGHFKGVATVVMKLFNIVRPDIVYFGQKDAQQAIVIKKMTKDLNMPVKVKVLPIVRERNGLAMSSRNLYLSPRERGQALSIYKSLKLAEGLYKNGERDSGKIIKRMRNVILDQKDAKIDYVSIVNFKTLKAVNKISEKALVALAVKFGSTRLIDNIILSEDTRYKNL